MYTLSGLSGTLYLGPCPLACPTLLCRRRRSARPDAFNELMPLRKTRRCEQNRPRLGERRHGVGGVESGIHQRHPAPCGGAHSGGVWQAGGARVSDRAANSPRGVPPPGEQRGGAPRGGGAQGRG
eukprot:878468-Pyramimonas_sp.AAC.1